MAGSVVGGVVRSLSVHIANVINIVSIQYKCLWALSCFPSYTKLFWGYSTVCVSCVGRRKLCALTGEGILWSCLCSSLLFHISFNLSSWIFWRTKQPVVINIFKMFNFNNFSLKNSWIVRIMKVSDMEHRKWNQHSVEKQFGLRGLS